MRPLFAIKKEINPVTLGLSLQAYGYLSMIFPERSIQYEMKSLQILELLNNIASKGWSGISWGYNFDWEAKYAKIPKYTPTVVATGFITHGMYEYQRIHSNPVIKKMILDSALFVVSDLNKTIDEDGTFCWSYSPNDKQCVLNATAKGARLLTEAFLLSGNSRLLDPARLTLQYVAQHQNSDGSWPYSIGDTRSWVDNHHTGYVLDCFFEYAEITSDHSFDEVIRRGFKYYLNDLFVNNRIPKYYNNSIYPLDCTAAAQAIITLCKFKQYELATNVAGYTFERLATSNGAFYYRDYKYFRDTNIYMRWSVAWMFSALSYLAYTLQSQRGKA